MNNKEYPDFRDRIRVKENFKGLSSRNGETPKDIAYQIELSTGGDRMSAELIEKVLASRFLAKRVGPSRFKPLHDG